MNLILHFCNYTIAVDFTQQNVRLQGEGFLLMSTSKDTYHSSVFFIQYSSIKVDHITHRLLSLVCVFKTCIELSSTPIFNNIYRFTVKCFLFSLKCKFSSTKSEKCWLVKLAQSQLQMGLGFLFRFFLFCQSCSGNKQTSKTKTKTKTKKQTKTIKKTPKLKPHSKIITTKKTLKNSIQPEEQKAEWRPHSSLPVPQEGLQGCWRGSLL